MSRKFDRFMVHIGIGTNRKLRRLPAVQRWVYVAGVLSLAAQSPIRGALLIADGEPATAEDIAEEATVPVKDARAALASLRRLGMLDRDSDGVEWVHDWDRLNPDPKPSDSPEAARERKRQQRKRERPSHADVTRDRGRDNSVTSRESHAPEVEGGSKKERNPPVPPLRGGDQRRKAARDEWVRTQASRFNDPDQAQFAIRQALDKRGVKDWSGVLAHITEWFPDLQEVAA